MTRATGDNARPGRDERLRRKRRSARPWVIREEEILWEEDMQGEQGAADLTAGAETEARLLLAAAFETAPVTPGLAAGLVAAAGPHGSASPANDVVFRVRKRAVRERRRRVLVPAGATALAAAVAGGVTAGVVTAGGVTASPSALTALTAALVKTSARSYTFTASANVRHGPTSSQGSVTGEFDPVNGTGKEQVRSDGDKWQIRYIGAHAYAHADSTTAKYADHLMTHGKPWVKFRLSHPSAEVSTEGVNGLIADIPTNPADLLAQLKSAATVRVAGRASGPGWTGTKYSFTLAPGSNQDPWKANGTVSVDSAGRVRQLVIRSSNAAAIAQGKAFGRPFENETLATFGGFGTPVTVAAPPARQVFDAGNKYLAFQPGLAPSWSGGVTP